MPRSVLEQDGDPEIIVLDNASTRDREMVREEFPAVSLHRHEQALGTTLCRDRLTAWPATTSWST